MNILAQSLIDASTKSLLNDVDMVVVDNQIPTSILQPLPSFRYDSWLVGLNLHRFHPFKPVGMVFRQWFPIRILPIGIGSSTTHFEVNKSEK